MGLSPTEIESLVRVLNEANVKSFTLDGLKICFRGEVIHKPVDRIPEVPYPPDPPATGVRTETKEEAVVPQGLEEDFDPQKILMWSTQTDEGSVPLTGDQILNDNPIKLPGETTPQVEGKP